VSALVPQIITNLEKSNYVANGPEDIAALVAASRLGEQVPSTYLRVLIAGVQVRSGMDAPRTSALRGKAPAVEDLDKDLKTIAEVHNEYYTVVLKTVTTPDIADDKGLRRVEAQRRAQERNKRSNFARSAKSVLVKFVKSGGNFRTLCVCSVTKPQLRGYIHQIQKDTKAITPADEARRHSSRLVRIVESIRKESEALAQMTVQDVIGQLSNMFELKPTSSARKAFEEGTLLKTPDGIFWPVHQPEAHMTQ
jgi:hypothetical protein